jgi:hypothetical protein
MTDKKLINVNFANGTVETPPETGERLFHTIVELIDTRREQAVKQLRYALGELAKDIEAYQYYGGRVAVCNTEEDSCYETVVWGLDYGPEEELVVTHDGKILVFYEGEYGEPVTEEVDLEDLPHPEAIVLLVNDLSRRLADAVEVIVDAAEDEETE